MNSTRDPLVWWAWGVALATMLLIAGWLAGVLF